MNKKIISTLLIAMQFTAYADCPYQRDDKDSQDLVKGFANQVSADLTGMEKERADWLKCAGVPMTPPSSAALIAQIAQKVAPQKNTVTSLMLAGQKISCPNTVDELGSVLEGYLFNARDVLGYNANSDFVSRTLTSSGSDGTALNKIFQDCYKKAQTEHPVPLPTASSSNTGAPQQVMNVPENTTSGPTSNVQSGTTAVLSTASPQELFDKTLNECLYMGIYNSPTQPQRINPSSFAGQVWALNCSTERSFQNSAEIQDLINQSQDEALKQKSVNDALTASIAEITKTLNQLTDPSHGSCPGAASALRLANTLISTTMSAATILGTPWAGLAANALTGPITNLVGSIGSGSKDIKKAQKLLEALDTEKDKTYGKYACILLNAQKNRCSDPVTAKEAAACAPATSTFTNNLNELKRVIEYSEVDKKDETGRKLGDQMEDFYKTMFQTGHDESNGGDYGIKLPGTNYKMPLASLIYGVENRQAEEAKHGRLGNRNLSRSLSYGMLDWYRENKDFANNANINDDTATLDAEQKNIYKFRDCYEQVYLNKTNKTDCKGADSSEKLRSMYNTMQGKLHKVDMQEYTERYLDGISKNIVDDKLQRDDLALARITAYEFRNQTKTSAADLNEQLVSPSLDAQYNRMDNMRKIFNGFNDNTGKGFIQHSVVDAQNEKNLKQIDKNKNALKNAKGAELDPNYFASNIYPLLRDCLLGYQMNTEKKVGGIKLRDDYKKMCGFLSNCGISNTIGVPFKYDDSDVTIDFENRKLFDPVCRAQQSYDTIVERAREEFEKSKSICGKSVRDPHFYDNK